MKNKRSDFVRAGQYELIQDYAGEEKALKPPSAIQQRLLDASVMDGPQSALYQHSVLCQTSIPYRDPKEIRTWQRQNGQVHLVIQAGLVLDLKLGRSVEVGLPYGPKARMILMHINQQALLTDSPRIDVYKTLNKFVEKMLKLAPHGRNLDVVKDQLRRLCAANMTLTFIANGKAKTDKSPIVQRFEMDLWFPKDDRQRVLWPAELELSPEYWKSLQEHAVPLNEDHIRRLSHSSLALDIYSWLAQRLHRVPVNEPALVSWYALHDQFGQGYNRARLDKFRQVFRVALKQVLALYTAAKVTENEPSPARRVIEDTFISAAAAALPGKKTIWRSPPLDGLHLHYSPPPVEKSSTKRRPRAAEITVES